MVDRTGGSSMRTATQQAEYARGSDSTPCIELHGAFDLGAARRAQEAVGQYAGTGEVLLDFGKVDVLHDAALATLAQELSRMPGVRLMTRGLRAHPMRLLEYLHIDPHTLSPLTGSEAPPVRPTGRWNNDLDD
jgi:anti-anti-sigma regulatory factor